jgi:FtsH-binding integral membrane protein
VLVASLVGIFVHLPLLHVGISAVAAVLFTGFLVYDLNRVARSLGATEGQASLLAVSVCLESSTCSWRCSACSATAAVAATSPRIE